MTLIEVVVAMALLASGVVGAVAGFDRVANATAAHERRAQATRLAEREVEGLRSTAYEGIGLSSASTVFVPEFEGRPTVRVADAATEPRSTVEETGTEFTVTRHVTWADVAGDGTGPARSAYKRLTVIVAWEHSGSTDSVRLDSGVSPMQQPERCNRRDTDGSPASVSGIVNRYYLGASSVDAGALAIGVTDSGRGTGAIAAGDLLLVVQMGGAAAGTYEYVMATSGVHGGVVAVTGAATQGGLLAGYDAAAGFQVVRVPTFGSTAVGALSAPEWDGSTGGVVAVDVAGTATLTGTIDVSGLGFTGARPGGPRSADRLLPGGGAGPLARGGGMVLLRTSSVSGTAAVEAHGRDGGSVVVLTETGGIEGVTVAARGQGGGVGGTVVASSLPDGVDVSADAPGLPGSALLDVGAEQIPGVGLGVGCRPALGIVVTTSTPEITQTGAATAVYSLVVTALADRPNASGVIIESILPAGLAHSVTGAVGLAGGATRDAVTTPALGAAAPSWGAFTIPAGGTVTITFTASVAAGLAPGTLQHSAVARYATPHGAAAAAYVAAMSTADDVLLVSGACTTPATDAAPPSGISGVVNTYHPGTATIAAGATSVPVGEASGASTPIAGGDVVLIMQVQGATIDGTNGNDYGDGAGGDTASGTTGIGQTGRYEYAVATGSVTGGRLPVSAMGSGGGLVNAYVAGPVDGDRGHRRYQVVRVPTFPDVTLGAVTALPWNGSVGGVVAIDVAGDLDLHGGSISATAAGFRGAGAVARSSNSGAISNSNGSRGGAKAEGIAGTPRSVLHQGSVIDTGEEGLPGGGFGTGAPGNAGGGGGFKAGGGGGSNSGDGGDGGRSPGSGDAGYGGAGVVTSADRLVLGGGGGATQLATGQADRKGHGGAGGGAVFVRATTISGAGTIEAEGASGENGMAGSGEESGGGGGGAGGSVLIASSTASLPSLAVSVDGGAGGDVAKSGSKTGSGGGGGGGTVRTTTTVAVSRAGGDAGNAANSARQAADGATGTTATIAAADVVGAAVGPGCRPLLRVTVTAAEPTVPRLRGQEVAWNVAVTNLASRPTATGVNVAGAVPATFGYTRTDAVTLTGGAHRTLTSHPVAGATNPAWGTFDLPAGGSVVITFAATPSGTVTGVVQSSARAAGAVEGVVFGSAYDESDGTGDDVALADVTTETTGIQAGDALSSATARVTPDHLWAADAHRHTTGAFGAVVDADRWLELPMGAAPVPATWSPVAGGAAITAAVRFAAPTPDATVCLVGSVIAAGVDVGTFGATGGPACVTGTTPSTTTVALPARTWTNAELRSLALRLAGTSTTGTGIVLDQARLDVTLQGSTVTVTPVRLVDASDGGSGTVTWTSPLAVDDGVVVTAGGPTAISTSFSSSRYVEVAFPASVPGGATVSGGALSLRTQAVGSGAVTLCWWAEVRNGANVVGTIGSTGAPACVANATVPSTQTAALPVLTAAQVNGATLRWYPRIAAGSATGVHLDLVTLSTSWSRP